MSMKAVNDENEYLDFIDRILESKEGMIQERTQEDSSYSNIVHASLRKWRGDSIDILAHSLRQSNPERTIDKWACSSVTLFKQLDVSLETAINDLHHFRKMIGEEIKSEAIEKSLSIGTFYDLLSLFHSGRRRRHRHPARRRLRRHGGARPRHHPARHPGRHGGPLPRRGARRGAPVSGGGPPLWLVRGGARPGGAVGGAPAEGGGHGRGQAGR